MFQIQPGCPNKKRVVNNKLPFFSWFKQKQNNSFSLPMNAELIENIEVGDFPPVDPNFDTVFIGFTGTGKLQYPTTYSKDLQICLAELGLQDNIDINFSEENLIEIAEIGYKRIMIICPERVTMSKLKAAVKRIKENKFSLSIAFIYNTDNTFISNCLQVEEFEFYCFFSRDFDETDIINTINSSDKPVVVGLFEDQLSDRQQYEDLFVNSNGIIVNYAF